MLIYKKPANCRNPEPWKKNEIQTGSQAEAVSTAKVVQYRPFGTVFFLSFCVIPWSEKKSNGLFKDHFITFPDPKEKKMSSPQLEELQGRFLF